MKLRTTTVDLSRYKFCIKIKVQTASPDIIRAIK